MRTPFRRYIVASVAGLAIAGTSIVSFSMTSTPAQAQFTVFDPTNYSQNVLTAARTLQQINNQITMLQNQAQSLLNQAKNLSVVSFNSALTNNQHVADARTRLATSMSAYQQTMTVQAQVVENIAADETTLTSLATRSQGSQGALQAQQTTNQLLALVAKQQFQLEHMMAAQYRADALESATRTQAQTDAQSATTKFLGSGTAYTPQ
jgi:conjugal transfer/entry exclusion protein